MIEASTLLRTDIIPFPQQCDHQLMSSEQAMMLQSIEGGNCWTTHRAKQIWSLKTQSSIQEYIEQSVLIVNKREQYI
jgi:hypothetical protein